MGFIYTLTSPSGKSYVGQTIRPIEERFDEHQNPSSGCVAIYGAIKKHGWEKFTTDYYECINDDLNKHERWMIHLMGTLAPGGII
jgi:group I intron endonuclease